MYKIVFTCGCFDLLSYRHISFLERASKLGDELIVSVNTDASVRRLKGEKRPVLNQEARLRMVRALKFVTHAELDDEDTPDKLLRFHQPDIFVKGVGNDPGNMPGVATCRELGIAIVILSNREPEEESQGELGESTTHLISRIAKDHAVP